MSALRKLVESTESESAGSTNANAIIIAELCKTQGRANEELRSFCTAQLDSQTRTVDTKLFVEILELFAVASASSESIFDLAEQLIATKKHVALLRLCSTYDQVDWDFVAMLRKLVQNKDWGSAEAMAKAFACDNDLGTTLVNETIAMQEFKRAHRLVHSFGLQAQFPDMEQLYSRDALLKLVEKQRWALALSFVGSDRALQSTLLSHLVAAGEWQHMTVLARDRMGLLDFDPVHHAASSSGGAGVGAGASSLATLPVHGYLALSLGDDSVVFCKTEDAVRSAAAYVLVDDGDGDVIKEGGGVYAFARVVGLDVEWKPTSSKIASVVGGGASSTAVASVLQIATASRVFLIDLLALHDNAFLFDGFLKPLLTSQAILKVGFGFDSDLKVLHQTFSEREAFWSVTPFLELSTLVQRACGAGVGNSLSNATACVLGHPLDKRMQLSNWDERPLSHSQVVYAALDAFCLLQIVDHVRDHRLSDNKGAVTTWENVTSQMIGSLGLSSTIDDPEAVATAVNHRRAYVEAWRSAAANGHGTIALKDLLTTEDVMVYWAKQVEHTSLSTNDVNSALQLIPVDRLESLLTVAQTQPNSAYVAVNSICFFADETPCVACIDATSKLDTSRLAGLCGLSRRKIKLATAVECETVWGFSPGTVPAFGHRSTSPRVRIFVDVDLQAYEQWVTGSGSHDHLLVFHNTAFFRLITVESIADIGLHRSKPRLDPLSQPPPIEPVDTTSPGIQEYKFLADTMVGRVGRWLRTIGIDVVVWDATTPYTSTVNRKSALLALATREQRIVLTRDKKLADRRDAGACFVVSSDDPHQQFQEVKTHFDLQLVKEEMMTRCAKCNHKGFAIVDRDYVRQQRHDVVHENVLQVVDEFWECRACRKIYWVGPKYSSAYENMMHKFHATHFGQV